MIEERKMAVEYFKGEPGFRRCFLAMRKKWKSLGKTGGKIKLENCSEDERRLLSGFLGQSFFETEISFSMKSFEDALKETRFGFLSLEELLELYFGEALLSNEELRQKEAEEWKSFWEQCNLYGTAACGWISEMQSKKTYGYKIVRKEWNQDPNRAQKIVENTGHAIERLQNRLQNRLQTDEDILLAVLAAEISGNPHYFDRGTAAGQLLTCALCWKSGRETPENSAELAELYKAHGIAMDDISNTVAAFGLHLERQGRLHPAYEGFLKEKESFLITGRNLESISRAYGEQNIVFVVENEMVFSHLCRQCERWPITILCTSGQPRKSAWRMLELLVSENMQIYYSGDLDPEGMDIADRIWKRYPENVHIWRMDASSYEASKSEESISQRRLNMLDRLENSILADTAVLLRKYTMAGYQEALLGEMVSDIQKKYRNDYGYELA